VKWPVENAKNTNLTKKTANTIVTANKTTVKDSKVAGTATAAIVVEITVAEEAKVALLIKVNRVSTARGPGVHSQLLQHT
jgi:hypothetical protein